MLYIVISYLWASILLYLLLGGADFGAGILELFTSDKHRSNTRKTMYKAIGPIWEANHMWLIIAIVILFVGFPAIYTTASVYLHIPLVIMLMGIIARGTAFSFRNYDAVVDEMQLIYSRIFVYASVITPLFLGIIAGSTVAGRIDPAAHDFVSAYVFSWLHWFSVAVGLFTVSICGFLAAVYLIGEADNETDRRRFITKTKTTNIAAFACGALVFIAAKYEKIPLAEWIFGNAVGILAISAASVSLILFWWLLVRKKTQVLRVLAAFQVTMILIAITYRHYPNIILQKSAPPLSLMNAANDKTIAALGWALLIGSIFILPALFYLIYSFDRRNRKLAGTGHT
ncbi:MAG: cytochrome d ubiquinol oxidase subunit II [Puia sp.]|nr:cytochrome d ubiquinol oxidase subunit II [Puia sp.]